MRRIAAGPLLGCITALKDLGAVHGNGAAEDQAANTRWAAACDILGRTARLSLPMSDKGSLL